MSDSEKRLKSVNKQVRMSPDEWAEIAAKAEAFGYKSVPQYMRDCAMMRPVSSVADQAALGRMVKAQADLGRLGGLLKKWLTGDWRDAKGHNQDIKRILAEIEDTQRAIREAARGVARVDAQ